jgi:hypothetical protein
MQGIVSFHPVDLRFFDKIVQPLVAGEKANPEQFLDAARRAYIAAWESLRYKLGLEAQLELLKPPPPPAEGSVWQKVRARLEVFDFKPDPVAKRVAETVEPDLHLHGRPFLITEGSADRVAALVDEYLRADGEEGVRALVLEQLVRLDPKIGGKIEPLEPGHQIADMVLRRELLAGLKTLYDLPLAARRKDQWGPPGGERVPAEQALSRELPWRAVFLHSRAVPFWIGRDVDGLDTVCRAAGVLPPACLAPPFRLFDRAREEFPPLNDSLNVELSRSRDVGAFVSPEEIPELLAFLSAEGARIIQAASRHGEGSTCATLLRKVRECARYAEQRGMGYLEACGIPPVGPEEDE